MPEGETRMKNDPSSRVEQIIIGLLFLVLFAVLASLAFNAVTAGATGEDLESGKTIYGRLCESCHGKTGSGDGPVGQYMTPKPANLGAEAHEHDDDFLFKVVKEGGTSVGKSAGMPAWGSQLKDDEIRNVISYIKTFHNSDEGHHMEHDEKHKEHDEKHK